MEVNKRNITSVSEKSNTNYAIGLRFKYFSLLYLNTTLLQVIAGSIHDVDTAQSEEKEDYKQQDWACIEFLTKNYYLSFQTPFHMQKPQRKTSHSERPQTQFCIIEQLFLITHQYFISFQTNMRNRSLSEV